jgi:hypothetical protein
MIFQVEITPIAKAQIEQAYRWYRELMNAIATLQEKPQRCPLAVEHEVFPENVHQLLLGKSKNMYRVLFAIRDTRVYILYDRERQAKQKVNAMFLGFEIARDKATWQRVSSFVA